MSHPLQIFSVLILTVLLTSCATPTTFTPEEAPEYVVIHNYTPFYRTGPMQSRGPDASLPLKTRLKVLSLEMGYSRVQLEDQRTGYVANENIAVAPPPPKEEEEPSRSRRSRSSSSGERYYGEQVNDIPLPDPVPPPDLNIAPEDILAPPPVPEATPEEPEFRF